MNGWTLAKYALMFAGLVLVVGSDRWGASWTGYAGLGLIVIAFLLGFPQRRALRRTLRPPEDGSTT